MKKLLVLVSLFFSNSIFAMSQPGLSDIEMNSSNGASNRPMAGLSDIVVSMAGTSADAARLANSETEMAANLLPEVKVDLDVCPDGRVLVNLCHSGPLKIKCSDKEIEVQANALMVSRLLAAKRRVVSSSYGAMFTAHDKLNLLQYPSSFITKFNDFLENKIKPSELSVGQIIEFLNLADYLQLKEKSKIKELCKELINKNFYFEDMKNTGLSDAALKYYLQTYIKERGFDLLKSGIITYKQTASITDHSIMPSIISNGKIAIRSTDNKARIIDITTGQVLHTITHDGWVDAVAISANGKIAITGSITGSYDNKARIIDVATGQVLHTITHDGWVYAAAITADGKIAITGSGDKKARIIDVKTGKVLHAITHYARVCAVAITADGSIAITGSYDNKVRIIDVATGQLLHIIDHDNWVGAVTILANGNIAITGPRGGKARIVEVDLAPIENADLDKLIEWYNLINADPISTPGTSSNNNTKTLFGKKALVLMTSAIAVVSCVGYNLWSYFKK